MAAQSPQPAPGRRPIRNFLLYAFAISIALHLLFGPFLGQFKRIQAEEKKEEVVTVEKIKVKPPPTPTPPPTPPPPTPPPTPPPKKTPPPLKSTPPPETKKLKVDVPKTTSKSQSGPSEAQYNVTKGSQEGNPQGNSDKGPAVAAPTTAPATAAPPATPAPPTPTPKPACAAPNVPPTTVNPVAPDTPEIAKQQGITGAVEVQVDLSAESAITNVSIHKTPNPVLNSAALAAAKASKFKTEVKNCVPIAASYLFIVEFQSS